jgi:hypothetical protein
MQISSELADALRPQFQALSADLAAAGYIIADHGLMLEGTTLVTSDDDGNPEELSEPAQAFVLAYTPPEPETPALVILRAIWQDTPFDDTAHAVIDALFAYLGG